MFVLSGRKLFHGWPRYPGLQLHLFEERNGAAGMRLGGLNRTTCGEKRDCG